MPSALTGTGGDGISSGPFCALKNEAGPAASQGEPPLKTITGYLAILFGGAGALITLVLIGCVWWGSFRLATETQRVAARADQSLVRAEEASGRLKQQLTATAESVEAVRAAARAAGQRPDTEATRAEIERARTHLLPLIERAAALSDALPPVADVLDDAASVAANTGNKGRAGRLRVTALTVRQAAAEMDAARARSAALSRADATPTAQELEALAAQCRSALDLLTSALSQVTHEAEQLRKELPEARRAVDEWTTPGAAILTVVLFWTGLGQLALVGWGRRRLTARAAAAVPQGRT
jgi:TM2 domain-containing membrane protein YozV